MKIILGLFSMTVFGLSLVFWYSGEEAYTRYGFQRFSDQEDWKLLTEFISTRYHDGDVVLFFPYYIRAPFDYYARAMKTRIMTVSDISSGPFTSGGSMPDPNWNLIQYYADRRSRIWLVLSHNQNSKLGRDVQTNTLIRLLDTTYKNNTEYEFTGIGLREYQ
jgi:hypothetical protein